VSQLFPESYEFPKLTFSSYALALDDANVGRQTFDVNLHDDDNERDQFDYTDDDDALRVRGTQLCVAMSTPGTLTLETCDNSRDDDVDWIQDWEFDDQDNQDWVRIEDDDDDSESNKGQILQRRLTGRPMLDGISRWLVGQPSTTHGRGMCKQRC
jgi:hypothetical protein